MQGKSGLRSGSGQNENFTKNSKNIKSNKQNFGGHDQSLNLPVSRYEMQNKSVGFEPSFVAGNGTDKSKNLNSLTHEPASKEAVRNENLSVHPLADASRFMFSFPFKVR